MKLLEPTRATEPMTVTGVGDVGFGVEFAFGVNAALNLALLHGLNDGRRAGQEIV